MQLLERESSLTVLQSARDELSSGEGRIVLVSGEAGIGKTSLIQRFADDHAGAARVLSGGCAALFTPHPLAPLYDMALQCDELAAALAAASDRATIFHATINYLSRASRAVILVFEDLHWADEATLDLIKFIGRRIARLPVLLIVSFRDEEVGAYHRLRSVIGDLPADALRRVSVPPLSRAAVEELAERAGRPAADLFAITGGNPFFVTEVICGGEASVPPTVRDAVMARVSRLSEPARAIAHASALVPRQIERWVLEAVVEVTGAALEECLTAGMVVRGHALAFRHELARRSVEEQVPVPVAQDLHARLVLALRGRSPGEVPPARVLYHADRAADSAAVLSIAPAVADQAAALGAHREAASHLAIAVRHSAALGIDARAALLDRLSYECYLTDQIAEAIRARESSLVLWRACGNRAREGNCLRWLSRLFWFSADKATADAYAAEAVSLLKDLPPGRELAMAYSNLAQLHMLADECDAAVACGQQALALAASLGDREVECHALINIGTARLSRQEPGGRAELERSLELALAGGFHEHAARAHCNLAASAIRRREFALAHRFLGAGIAYCEERDLDSWARYLVAFRSEAWFASGDWEPATHDAEAIASDTNVAPVTRVPALVALGRLRTRRGDPRAEAPLAEACQLALASGERQRLAPVIAARAESAWLRGALGETIDDVAQLYAQVVGHPDPWLKEELAFWLWRAGRLTTPPAGIAGAYALQIRGDWKAAARAWEALGCPYEQGVALADSGQESSLRAALEIFDRLGAAPMAASVRRQLRAIGIRGIPRGAHERTRRNPHSLTRRELQVLTLLAEGRRNADIARRLFVAEKTVDHHVSAVLAKLQVASRGEAAAVAHQLGLPAFEPPAPIARGNGSRSGNA